MFKSIAIKNLYLIKKFQWKINMVKRAVRRKNNIIITNLRYKYIHSLFISAERDGSVQICR